MNGDRYDLAVRYFLLESPSFFFSGLVSVSFSPPSLVRPLDWDGAVGRRKPDVGDPRPLTLRCPASNLVAVCVDTPDRANAALEIVLLLVPVVLDVS